MNTTYKSFKASTAVDRITIDAQTLDTGELLLTLVCTSLVDSKYEKTTVTQLSGADVTALKEYISEL